MTTPCTPKPRSLKLLLHVPLPIAILGIAAGGMFACLRYGFLTRQLLRENERATEILVEKVETLRLYSWDQITRKGFIPSTVTDAYDPSATNATQKLAYSGTVTIAACPLTASYASDLRQLSVTLNWTNRGIPRTRRLTTYIAKVSDTCCHVGVY